MLDSFLLMRELAGQRQVFHSEADFQHAFAWLVLTQFADADIRLECPAVLTPRTRYLDIFAKVDGQRLAIELKYKTRAIEVMVAGEAYSLKSHGAQDLGRYDFLRDVERVETAVGRGISDRGIAVLLTNDSAYWTTPFMPGSAYEAFSLHEGRELSGSLSWGPTAGPGTVKGRETPICLNGCHRLAWQDYSQLARGSYGRFRFMVIEVAR